MQQPLDRESQDLVEVIISITDEGIGGSEPNTVSLRREISILDENDNVPEFHNRPYSANISESSPIGSTLLVSNDIIVTDNDGGVNADVTITCFTESNMLYVDDVCETFNVRTEKVCFPGFEFVVLICFFIDFRRIVQGSDIPQQAFRFRNEIYVHFDTKSNGRWCEIFGIFRKRCY